MEIDNEAQKYWDSQFKFSSILPDFSDWLLHFASASVKFADRRKPEVFSYGKHPRQWVELWGEPGCEAALPVFIHGGYWRALDAADHRFALEGLINVCGAAANLEYRLMPNHRLAELVTDVVQGLEQISLETGRPLLVIGHSAGAHLAFEAALAAQDLKLAGLVGISGIYDLEPIRFSFLQSEISLTSDEITAHSPASRLHGSKLNFMLALGEQETPEFHRQARIIQARKNAPVLLDPGRHHMSVLDSLISVESVLMQAIVNHFGPQRATER